MDKLPKFDEWEKRIELEKARIRGLLQTDDGKALIEHLTRIYDGSLVAKVEGRGVDREQTLINIGAREVVHYLRSLKDREKKA